MTVERGEIQIAGIRRAGLIFRISTVGVPGARLGQVVTSMALAALGLASVFFLVTAGPRTDAVAMVGRAIWILGAVFSFGLLVVLWISWRTPMWAAILGEGIYSKSALGQVLIPGKPSLRPGNTRSEESAISVYARTRRHASRVLLDSSAR